jgi:hypothetical protein
MNHLLILLCTILIIGLSAPVYAETISDHVVINEVDTNPFGDDSQSISEWVELYNPTDSDVDLSGWKIASTTVLKKTLTIPDGTIIGSDKLLKFTHEKIWFTDVGESVELRNSIDKIIDKTPSISDKKNDFFSWQRSYDGHTDWEFSLATAGGSNGKLTLFNDSSIVEVTLSTDKINYIFDETAIIQGSVSEKVYVELPTFQPEPISINISGPNFERMISLYPDSNLNYETNLDLVQVLGISRGTYDVTVNYAGISENISFFVDYELIESDEIVNSVFSINTDENEYSLNQSILLHGMTTEVIPFESMTFSVIDPDGKQIDAGNLFTTDGKFTTSIYVNSVYPVYGDYIVTAEYDEKTASAKFTLIEHIVDVEDVVSSNDMIFALDDFEYFENDYMVISGTIPNFDSTSDIYYQVVYLNFYTSDGKVVNFVGMTKDTSARVGATVPFSSTAVPNSSGEFTVHIRIPSVVFTVGDYVVKANYGGLLASESFSIVSERNSSSETTSVGNGNPNASIPGKSSSIEKKDAGGYVVSDVQTKIEKVNRISDNLISINTQEKTLSDKTMQPRVLSGSMMSISKETQSTVNLQVSSESGICIIGQNPDCLVSESTRKPGQIFEVVQVDGLNLNVRYSGSDVRLEKFSILPESSDEFLPNTNWNVEVIKDDEISRMYYKVTYKTNSENTCTECPSSFLTPFLQ